MGMGCIANGAGGGLCAVDQGEFHRRYAIPPPVSPFEGIDIYKKDEDFGWILFVFF